MMAELNDDEASDLLYISPRLSPAGVAAYPQLLREACERHTDDWLAASLQGLLNTHENRKKPKGGVTSAQVPVNAHETLAEGEFNRFYCRAICLRAIEESGDRVTVYRAKAVATPRPESEHIIGSLQAGTTVLADLRSNIALGTILGVPGGPNSGLSIHL